MTLDGLATRDNETRAFSLEERSFSRGELPCGARAGNYSVVAPIARGGCGAVYEARHLQTGARVAMKVLHGTLAASPKMVKRFLREIEVVRLLNHPGIVDIHDAGELPDGRPFYVMEHLDGLTLDVLLRQEGRLSPERALELLEPVCSALDAAHAAGIIHRDVKGSNIFVSRGAPRAVKLLDFGIAKLMEPEEGASGFTTAGRAPGTLTIMAPEQILGGPLDARVDVYALGVLLHRLLTGKLPFYSPDAAELLRQHLEEPPPRPSRRTPLPPALDAIVLRCLEKQPEHRYPSVKSFLCALREAVGEPTSGRSSTPELETDAIAVYLDLRLCTDADDLDDALAEELGLVLDLAEERLRDAGLTLVSVTGSEILAARLLSCDAGEALRERAAVIAIAAALHEEIAQRSRPDARVHPNLCLHAGRVVVRWMPHPEIIGGDLARVGAWAPAEPVHGLCATEEAIRGVGGLELSAGPGRLALIGEPSAQCSSPAPTLRSRAI
ncbi:serine/threonine-protein kinase [Sorangium sp. So ce185]|uniref:serine/threonine-protein kinase n=1 Tax=Sorangium sp. So ce185 TaxID=3133287 RepID=UPI003F5F832A